MKPGVEPYRGVPDPARFWGLTQVKSEGGTKHWVHPDVKSTSHQNIGTPGKLNRKAKPKGDLGGAGKSSCIAWPNVGIRMDSTDDKLVPAKITVTWSPLEAKANNV